MPVRRTARFFAALPGYGGWLHSYRKRPMKMTRPAHRTGSHQKPLTFRGTCWRRIHPHGAGIDLRGRRGHVGSRFPPRIGTTPPPFQTFPTFTGALCGLGGTVVQGEWGGVTALRARIQRGLWIRCFFVSFSKRSTAWEVSRLGLPRDMVKNCAGTQDPMSPMRKKWLRGISILMGLVARRVAAPPLMTIRCGLFVCLAHISRRAGDVGWPTGDARSSACQKALGPDERAGSPWVCLENPSRSCDGASASFGPIIRRGPARFKSVSRAHRGSPVCRARFAGRGSRRPLTRGRELSPGSLFVPPTGAGVLRLLPRADRPAATDRPGEKLNGSAANGPQSGRPPLPPRRGQIRGRKLQGNEPVFGLDFRGPRYYGGVAGAESGPRSKGFGVHCEHHIDSPEIGNGT